MNRSFESTPPALRRSALTLTALLSAAIPAMARAGVPPPQNSTIPAHVILVGRDASGQPDPRGRATVVIRDLANNPLPGVSVAIDFSATPDMGPSQTQPDPAILNVNCSARTLIALTGADGSVTFSIVGRANRGIASVAQGQTLRFYADGVFLGTAIVSAPDQDGDGVNAVDLSYFLSDFFTGQYLERSDHDGNGFLSASDLSALLTVFFGSQSIQGGGPACP
jgi:hypothetical protein